MLVFGFFGCLIKLTLENVLLCVCVSSFTLFSLPTYLSNRDFPSRRPLLGSKRCLYELVCV